jgi:hypothetical protein
MTNEEIRKLLGGYATNTLTDAERKVLFEAALDDQELFNAMQEEQALKDLLADPVAREQVREALEKPAAGKNAGGWWSQWWAWGSVAGAVAAAVVIVAVIRSNPSELRRKDVAVATTMVAPVAPPAGHALKSPDQPTSTRVKNRVASPKPEPWPAKLFRPPPSPVGAREERKNEVAIAVPPPVPPAAAATAPAEVGVGVSNGSIPSSGAPGAQNAAGHSQNQVAQDAISNQAPPSQQQIQTLLPLNRRSTAETVMVTAGTGGFASGPLRYSLIKRESNGDFVPVQANPDLKKGDAVQLRVMPALSGFVSLSQLDQSGNWKRVFPPSGPGIPVVANNAYSLPATAIEVTDKDEKFRVILSLATPETVGEVAAAKDMKSRKRAAFGDLQKAAPETSPLFVDLTIGPKK